MRIEGVLVGVIAGGTIGAVWWGDLVLFLLVVLRLLRAHHVAVQDVMTGCFAHVAPERGGLCHCC